jgi:hypothetical protein
MVSVQSLTRREVLKVIAATLGISAVLWAGGKILIENTEVPVRLGREANFMHAPTLGRLANVARTVLVNAVVMTRPSGLPASPDSSKPIPVVHLQESLPGQGGALEWMAILLWLVVFGLGLLGFWRSRSPLPLKRTLAVYLACTVALYAVYGEETFLFVVSCLPYLLIIAAHMVHVVPPKWGTALLAGALLVVATSNWRYFDQVASAYRVYSGVDARQEPGIPRTEQPFWSADALR